MQTMQSPSTRINAIAPSATNRQPTRPRDRIIQNILRSPLQYTLQLLRSICAATSEILFLRGIIPGALLLSAMLLQPSVLLLGLVALLAAIAFAHLTQVGQGYREQSPFLYNPFLAGLSVGYLFQLSPAALLLAAASGVLAFLLTWVLAHILRTFFYLPVLSLPFILVSWVVHLAAFRYAGLQAATVPVYAYSIGWALPVEGFLRTLGLIFFLPNVWVGMVVMALLVVNSRIQFFLAVAGYALGTTLRAVLTGTFAYVYYDAGALNFILVALAIGGFYLLPSPRSYLLSGVGVVLAALVGEAIAVFWTAVALPVHAMPYNLATLLMLYLLGLAGSQLLVRVPQASPEKTLDQEITNRLRYQGSGRTLALPIAGNWLVWQGFEGAWTHQGLWRYACDFLIQDDQGQTHRGNGSQLTDYYAFQKPILSPVRGWVVQVVQDLPDCAIGTVDADHNWGNAVVLYDERGFYVELSHFAQNSIAVKPGDRIERGTFLGRCGNSGYSPQPHLHLQVQLTPELGAATVPFSFTNLTIDGAWCQEGIPPTGAQVEPGISDATLAQAFSFTLESQLQFQVNHRDPRQCDRQVNRPIGALNLTVRMAVDGTFYLDSGKARLYFSRTLDGFMFHTLEGEDPHLAMLLLAMPRLPFTRQVGQQWQDYLPIGRVISSWRRLLYPSASSLLPHLASARFTGQWQSPQQISGAIAIPGVRRPISTAVYFSRDGHLERICVGDRTLIRQFPPDNHWQNRPSQLSSDSSL